MSSDTSAGRYAPRPRASSEARYERARSSGEVKQSDRRTETEKDRGRLQYSPYLRRLAGVTQVVSPELTSSKLHSRASHTYKVAMISREIADNLSRRADEEFEVKAAIERAGGLDVTACEAAGLAHDLGHPPFGHAGESELNRLLRSRGVREGFEGNAQSFRIVCALDWHNYDRGLDLTNVVLAAILKYPWLREPDVHPDDDSEQSKFGAYESEAKHLREARKAVLPQVDDEAILEAGKQPSQSLEASVMDLADDIAYSIHDLEDFCSQGFINLTSAVDSLDQYVAHPTDSENAFARSAGNLRRYNPDQYDPAEHVKAASRIKVLLETVNTPEWSQSARDQQLRGMLSQKIAEFFASIAISAEVAPVVTLHAPQWHEMQVMKQVTKHYLVFTSRMGQIQRAQRKTIERLFLGLEEWLQGADELEALPDTLKEFMAIQGVALSTDKELDSGHYRAISDYICTMSDSEAFLRAQWITGTEIPGMANLGLVD